MPTKTLTKKRTTPDSSTEALRGLGIGISHFAKTTNRMFYFYLEELQIKESENTGNLMVSYSCTDEEGSRDVIRVYIEPEGLKYQGFEKLIAGVDRAGQPHVGNSLQNSNEYFSAFSLLIADIVTASEKLGGGIGEVMVYGIGEPVLPSGRVVNHSNGELKVIYGSRRNY